VRPVLIMVGLVLAQDPPQVVLIPDEGAVQKLAPTSADPAFSYRVHARRLHVAEHGPDPGISEDPVERGREVRAAVADHELDPVCLLSKVHHQVASLLGRPYITRQSAGHVAFGHGIHHCVGAPLARLEGQIAIGWLLRRFSSIVLDGDPGTLRWRDSTLMHGLCSLPVRVLV
jgi:hypothetical protein